METHQKSASTTKVAVELPTLAFARDYPRALIAAQLRNGDWVKVRRGAYVETAYLNADDPEPPHGIQPSGQLPSFAAQPNFAAQPSFAAQRRMALAHIAAVAVQKSRFLVFSHGSAALLWGLPVWRIPARTHGQVKTRTDSAAGRGMRHHHFKLDPQDVDVRLGLPVTSLERTVLDSALAYPPAHSLVIADAALRAGARSQVIDQLVRQHSRHNGIRKARFIAEFADPGSESPWESITRLVLLSLGLPRPELQIPVRTRLGPRFLDMGWEEWLLGIEFDGFVKYGDLANGDPGRVIFEEKRRQDAIEEEGWRILRVTKQDLEVPDELFMRISRFLPAQLIRQCTPRPELLLGWRSTV